MVYVFRQSLKTPHRPHFIRQTVRKDAQLGVIFLHFNRAHDCMRALHVTMKDAGCDLVNNIFGFFCLELNKHLYTIHFKNVWEINNFLKIVDVLKENR
jgi:hypothetical protein